MPGVPKGWLGCPALPEDVIANKFMVFKTPYTNNSGLASKDRFTIEDVVHHVKSLNQNLLCWIDLTNTSRYYKSSEVSSYGFEYHKLACLGHGSAPSEADVQGFIRICREFQDSDGVIAVHCTHGFNRTGYLICKYLISELKYSAEDAVIHFAKCRPPGIYRPNYIEELCPNSNCVQVPQTPSWVSGDSLGEAGDRKRQRGGSHSSSSKKHRKRAGNFYCDLPIIDSVDDHEGNHVKNTITRTSGWYLQDLFVKHNKLKNENKEQLFRGNYAFKIKSTKGRKYILYIEERNRVYFLDAELNVFKANLVFPMLDYQRNVRHLFKTIVIGEMKHLYPTQKDEPKQPAYAFVIEDIIIFRGEYVAEAPFFDRMKIIKGNLVDSRRIQSSSRNSTDLASDVLSIQLDQYHKLPTIDTILKESGPVLPEKIVFYSMREPFGLPPRSSTLEYSVVKTFVNFRIGVDEGKNYLYCRDSEKAFSTLEESEDSPNSSRLSDGEFVQCRYKSGRWILERKLDNVTLIDSISTAENAKDHRKLTIHSLKKFLAARLVKYR